MKIIVQRPDELTGVAKKILDAAGAEKVFTLYGEMGAGKTTLVKACCRQLGIAGAVTSPTFAVVNEYEGREKVFHIDLYRMKNLQEVLDIGIEEYLTSGNYCFIEWPQLIEALLPQGAVNIRIMEGDGGRREFYINE